MYLNQRGQITILLVPLYCSLSHTPTLSHSLSLSLSLSLSSSLTHTHTHTKHQESVLSCSILLNRKESRGCVIVCLMRDSERRVRPHKHTHLMRETADNGRGEGG